MLVIPPGWRVVNKSTNPYSRIQVKCLDSKGRSQYIYHPLWSVLTSALKYKKLLKFCKVVRKIGKISDRKTEDIDNIIKLMLYTNIRLGSDKYAEENDSFGLCTLETKHVIKGVNRDEIILRFAGKSGHVHDIKIHKGPELKFIREKARDARNAGSKRLFPSGTADRLRCRFKELLGSDFNPKDIRTYKANMNLVLYLRRCPGVNLKKELVECVKKTACNLHHTPSVCKSNYLCPQLIELWMRNPGAIKEGVGINLYKVIKRLGI